MTIDILAVTSPAEAATGESVPLTVRVKNSSGAERLFATLTASVNGVGLLAWVPAYHDLFPRDEADFRSEFIMPDADANITIWSWKSYGAEWILQDSYQHAVILPGGWALVANKSFILPLGLITVNWVLVVNKTFVLPLGVITVNWILVVNKTFVLPLGIITVNWILVANKSFILPLGLITVNWVLVTSKTFFLPIPGEPPDEEKKNLLPLVLLAGGAGLAALGLASKPKGTSSST